jgi:hypothetical protein
MLVGLFCANYCSAYGLLSDFLHKYYSNAVILHKYLFHALLFVRLPWFSPNYLLTIKPTGVII